jgi:hypothetical protein
LWAIPPIFGARFADRLRELADSLAEMSDFPGVIRLGAMRVRYCRASGFVIFPIEERRPYCRFFS